MTNEEQKQSALADVRVLDFTTMMAGPYCTRLLADLGADVVKVESPNGDEMRNREPMIGSFSRYFGHLNAGKKSVRLDLRHAGVIEAMKAIAKQVDVVIENFRPGVMKRLGLDFGALSAINPRLIYCSISGYGQSGPESLKPAYAPMVHAASGYDLVLKSASPDDRPPSATNVFVADIMAGQYAAFAIQTALLQRERTGEGQQIDVTLMESMLNLLIYEVQSAQHPSSQPRPQYLPLRALDGFIVVLPINSRNFESLCRAIGCAELISDPRFSDSLSRVRNWAALMGKVEDWTCTRTSAECESLLLTAGVPASRYRTVAEALDSAQLAHRGTFATVQDGGGSYKVTCMPILMSGSKTRVGATVPMLGEHTRVVLRDWSGLNEAAIEDLCGPQSVSEGSAS